MGIIKPNIKKPVVDEIKLSDEVIEKINSILDNQSKVYMAIGILNEDYDISKSMLKSKLNTITEDYNNLLKELEKKYGKGIIDSTNWLYKLQDENETNNKQGD